MEGCKERAKAAGLTFQDETLEYIVTNKDLLELSPKNMIPTLYDYWVHDVEVLKEKGKYELYPHNPYETVINTRPAISFYNDNNPDWLNVMIFYHVLAHIDFFQNNYFFRHTWHEDFAAQALSDKRTIAQLRSEKGRFVDYVIEFARGIDNLVGYYNELSDLNRPEESKTSTKLDFYFDHFLQTVAKVPLQEYLKEVERYNQAVEEYGLMAESVFFSRGARKYPEVEALFTARLKEKKEKPKDLCQFIEEHSPFLRKEENKWKKTVMEIVRKTSVYFQPQIRTKILNEGWASYWHEKLFISDDRIKGNEVAFATVNAKVTSLPRVGLNPYALGMRLFDFLEESADKGRISYAFQKMKGLEARKEYDQKTGQGRRFIFQVRENFNDFMFINTFVDQDFVDAYKLFVTGKRLNAEKNVWEYYVKSRKASAYKEMLLDALYHPPHVKIHEPGIETGVLYLDHQFEEKPLVKEYIGHTLLGIEYLWGGPVKLETTELVEDSESHNSGQSSSYNLFDPAKKDQPRPKNLKQRRILYTMEKRKLSKVIL